MTAFKNLPPWSDFVKGRDSDMLRMRQAYTAKLQEKHRATLKKHSKMATEWEEALAHDRWEAAQVRSARGQEPAEPRLPCPACASHAAV